MLLEDILGQRYDVAILDLVIAGPFLGDDWQPRAQIYQEPGCQYCWLSLRDTQALSRASPEQEAKRKLS